MSCADSLLGPCCVGSFHFQAWLGRLPGACEVIYPTGIPPHAQGMRLTQPSRRNDHREAGHGRERPGTTDAAGGPAAPIIYTATGNFAEVFSSVPLPPFVAKVSAGAGRRWIHVAPGGVPHNAMKGGAGVYTNAGALMQMQRAGPLRL